MSVCAAIKSDGERCKGIAIEGSDHCYAHHPDYAKSRKDAARRGGKRGGQGRPQVQMRDIKALLEDLTDRVLEGELPTSMASVANQLIKTRLRALEAERKIKETEELEQRIEALEKAAARKGARQWHAGR